MPSGKGTSFKLFQTLGGLLVTLCFILLLTACSDSTDDSSDNSSDSTAPTTTVDIPGGTYLAAQSVTLSVNETATTYYTTDGSTPDTSSSVYSSAISISANTTLQYFSEDSAGNAESINTDSYIIATTTATTGAYNIVDTNQTDCYNSSTGAVETCASVGYDADYTGNTPDYTLSGDSVTVLDNITGLTWTQSTDIDGSGAVDYNDKLYQSEAISYCRDLTSGGYSDWRLPHIKEAYSLILFSGRDASTYLGTITTNLVVFIDGVFDEAFGDTVTTEGLAAADRIIDGQYASTTSYVSTTMGGDATMFGVNYVDGRIKGYPSDTKEFYVRCVRGDSEYGLNNFSDNGDGTISDDATGLMWESSDSSSTNFDDAISVCETASTATYTDWRLPNAKELQSIVDYSRSPDTSTDAAINSVFTSTSFANEENITDWGYYWASTTHVENDDAKTNLANNYGQNGTYLSFGRALGYFFSSVLDVHGAGSQRSNHKNDISTFTSATDANALFYYNGPQGDILRLDNKVRCVR